MQNKLTDNYNRIIDKFYGSYTPKFYKRRNSKKYGSSKKGSLYDLICFEIKDGYFTYGFDETKISRRDGFNGVKGLYTTVFIQGYHGGAFIPDAKKFLVPWTYPYYKYNGDSEPWDPKPWEVGDEKYKHGWSRAVRTTSPYRMFISYIDWYNSGQYQKDFEYIFYRNYAKYF